MGNEVFCSLCQPRNDQTDLDIEQKNELRLTYNRNLINRQKIFEAISNSNDNDLSLIGITYFKNISYINVNLQVLSRLKHFTNFIDINFNMNKEVNSLKTLRSIFNNLFKGFPCNADIKNFISDIDQFQKDNESSHAIDNDPLNFHQFILEYINHLIFKDKPLIKYHNNTENTSLTNREILKKKEAFRMTFENEIQEMFYLGFINSFNTECVKCLSQLTNFELFCLSHIDLSTYNISESLQENIDKNLYESKTTLKDCLKCSSKNIIKEVNQIINYPKYLLVRIQLIEGLDIDKISEIKIHKRVYELTNIIFILNNQENIKEFTFSTKIKSIWYHCENDNKISTIKGYLLNNCYILYFSRHENTQ